MQEPTAPACSDFPEWVLLDTIARIGRCNNATTAGTVTSTGGHIEVSFEVADPPALTRCVVHCPELTPDEETPTVTGADGAFLLIRVIFPRRSGGCSSFDVFVYRAGPGNPSLQLLPLPYPIGLPSSSVGVLSCGDHCLVVVPIRRFDADHLLHYDLRVFSGKTMSWSTKAARLACNLEEFYRSFVLTKVFAVDGGSLAWVDLRYGILLCNSLLEDVPELRVIHLPPLMLTNKDKFPISFVGDLPPLDFVRDVTFRNGSFRFIEMEYPELDCDADDDDTELSFRWTTTTFRIMVGSEEWEQEPLCAVDSADLSPADSCFPCLFPEIWDCKENKILNRVMCSDPTLDMYRDDAVYVIAKTGARDPNGWVFAVNTKNKELDKVLPFSAERVCFNRSHLQCSFSKHLRNA
ncbi:hypothetical protein EJB05_39447, partial [Eragrostis curvula]